MNRKKSLAIALLLIAASKNLSASSCGQYCNDLNRGIRYYTGRTYTLKNLLAAFNNSALLRQMVERNIEKRGISNIETDMLFYTVFAGQRRALQSLINCNISPNVNYSGSINRIDFSDDDQCLNPRNNQSLLEYAVEMNSTVDIVGLLIPQVDAETRARALFLEVAKWNANKDVLELLATADIANSVNAEGKSILQLAVQQHSIGLIEKLMKLGADATVKNIKGKTLLEIGLDNPNADFSENTVLIDLYNAVHAELDQDTKNRFLHKAAERGFLSYLVQHLITQGADVNSILNGKSVLHRATQHGSLDLLKYLVSLENLNINTVDENGNTALAVAISCEYNYVIMVIKLLLDNNIDRSIRNHEGLTALQIAINNHSAKKDNKNIINAFYTDMHFNTKAIKETFSQEEIASLAFKLVDSTNFTLLNNFLSQYFEHTGLDIRSLVKDGQTLLTYAVSAHKEINRLRFVMTAINMLEIVEFLVLSCKISVNDKDQSGKSAMKIAQNQSPQNTKMLGLLTKFNDKELVAKVSAAAQELELSGFGNQSSASSHRALGGGGSQ